MSTSFQIIFFLDDHCSQWGEIKRGGKKIFRVNRKLKEVRENWDEVVTANNVKGGKEDGDQLNQGVFCGQSVGGPLALKQVIIFNISYYQGNTFS